MGLAVGFILGGSISRLVSSIVNDLINPLIGLGLGKYADLKDIYIPVFNAKIGLGSFLAAAIDFLIIAAVVYFGVKKLGLDKIDKPKT